MARYILADRKRTHVKLTARLGNGEFSVVRPVRDSVLEFSEEQAATFADDIRAKLASGEIVVASES